MNMKKVKLNIGCGNRKRNDEYGIDMVRTSKVNLVHNLDRFPWPIHSDSFEYVYACHTLEHLHDIPRVLKEIHRIGKNGATVRIIVPFYSNVSSFRDVTHKHFFSYGSLDPWFKQADALYRTDLGYKFSFIKNNIKINFLDENLNINYLRTKKLINKLFRFFLGLISIRIYERFLAFIIPSSEIEYILEIKK